MKLWKNPFAGSGGRIAARKRKHSPELVVASARRRIVKTRERFRENKILLWATPIFKKISKLV
jgi:hypothetical protein